MGDTRASWGAVNAVLNRLIAEGMIAAFRTSFRGPAPELGVHVIVTPVEPITATCSISEITRTKGLYVRV